MPELFNQWTALWRELRAEGDPRPAYQRLTAAYSEPSRHYHNLQHLDECLAELAGIRPTLAQPAWVAAAVWFHDAVYDSQSSTNEGGQRGAGGEIMGGAGVDPVAVSTIRALILCTKAHEPGPVPDAAALIDIDLAILGQPMSRFWEYERAIRAEYAWVPREKYAEGRAAILNKFLQRPAIYRTASFFSRYETAARNNLQAAITALNR